MRSIGIDAAEAKTSNGLTKVAALHASSAKGAWPAQTEFSVSRGVLQLFTSASTLRLRATDKPFLSYQFGTHAGGIVVQNFKQVSYFVNQLLKNISCGLAGVYMKLIQVGTDRSPGVSLKKTYWHTQTHVY